MAKLCPVCFKEPLTVVGLCPACGVDFGRVDDGLMRSLRQRLHRGDAALRLSKSLNEAIPERWATAQQANKDFADAIARLRQQAPQSNARRAKAALANEGVAHLLFITPSLMGFHEDIVGELCKEVRRLLLEHRDAAPLSIFVVPGGTQ